MESLNLGVLNYTSEVESLIPVGQLPVVPLEGVKLSAIEVNAQLLQPLLKGGLEKSFRLGRRVGLSPRF